MGVRASILLCLPFTVALAAGDGPARAAAPARFDDESPLLRAKTVDEFIRFLQDWSKANGPMPGSRGEKVEESKEKKDGVAVTVSRRTVSITETPDEIITFQPVNGFWLGALVQGRGLRLGLGSTQEIPVPAAKRAPFKVTVDLPDADNFRRVDQPSASAVGAAVGDLMRATTRPAPGGGRTIKVVENQSEDQVAHDLGVSARYATAALKSAFSSSRRSDRHTISVVFQERAFTATADFEGRSRREAFFSDRFTIEDARALVEQDRIGPDNLPAYIKSITYGRTVIFNLTSTTSADEMKEAVEGSFDGPTWGLKLDQETKQSTKSAQFELRVTELGGPQGSFSKLIPGDKTSGIANVLGVMNSYLQAPASISTMVPISYTANTLRDDQLATMSVTTSYVLTSYKADAIGEKFRIKMWFNVDDSDDGIFDNTLEVYGGLKVNGTTWWEVPRSEAQAFQREKGQRIEVSEDMAHRKPEATFLHDEYYDKSRPFAVSMYLRDRDEGSGDDDVYKLDRAIELKENAGKELTFPWDSGEGEAATLHILIERIGFL